MTVTDAAARFAGDAHRCSWCPRIATRVWFPTADRRRRGPVPHPRPLCARHTPEGANVSETPETTPTTHLADVAGVVLDMRQVPTYEQPTDTMGWSSTGTGYRTADGQLVAETRLGPAPDAEERG